MLKAGAAQIHATPHTLTPLEQLTLVTYFIHNAAECLLELIAGT